MLGFAWYNILRIKKVRLIKMTLHRMNTVEGHKVTKNMELSIISLFATIVATQLTEMTVLIKA